MILGSFCKIVSSSRLSVLVALLQKEPKRLRANGFLGYPFPMLLPCLYRLMAEACSRLVRGTFAKCRRRVERGTRKGRIKDGKETVETITKQCIGPDEADVKDTAFLFNTLTITKFPQPQLSRSIPFFSPLRCATPSPLCSSVSLCLCGSKSQRPWRFCIFPAAQPCQECD